METSKYFTQYENHIHLIYGFIDLVNFNEFFISNITITKNKTIGTNPQVEYICNDDKTDNKTDAKSLGIASSIDLNELKYFTPSIILHIKRNYKYDNLIKLPDFFDPELLSNYKITVNLIVRNNKKSIYNEKISYYKKYYNKAKLYKYQTKKLLTEQKNNYEKMTGGTRKLNEISEECKDNPPEKIKSFIPCYTEPIINEILDIITAKTGEFIRRPYDMSNLFVYESREITIKKYIDLYSIVYAYLNPTEKEDRLKILVPKYISILDNLYQLIKTELDRKIKLFPEGNHRQYYSMILDIFSSEVSETDFKNNTWTTKILLHHLKNNKYAHNGINDESTVKIGDIELKIFDHVKQNLMITNDWILYQLLHSLLHLYDSLYMSNDYNLRDTNDEIDIMMRSMNEKQSECVRKIINSYGLDFLIKDDGGFVVPYSIKPEAFESKIRQYGHSTNTLRKSFEYQIINNRPMEKVSNTANFPPSDLFH